jgi:hypothetical protein
MSDHMKHTEKVYIDEVTRKGRGTFQWFVEPRSELNNASHPISQNNQLDVFICGEKGFASIAADIKNAKSSLAWNWCARKGYGRAARHSATC